MDIKDKIQGQIKRNEEVLNFLKERGRDYKNSDKVILDYLEKLKDWYFDSGLTIDFANCLQLSNSMNNFGQYDLEDIRGLFHSGLRLHEYNLETYIELGQFEHSVMDNVDNAERIVDEGIKKAKEKD